MKQTIDTKNGMQYYTLDEISGKIQRDIEYLQKKFEIIADEYENILVRDLERFFVDGIALEIRLTLYDPLQNNCVFLEYSYRTGQDSSFSADETLHDNVEISDIPETCLFDIFIYFTTKFSRLKPEAQKQQLKFYNIDWYEINFNLRYSKKDKPVKTDSVSHDSFSSNIGGNEISDEEVAEVGKRTTPGVKRDGFAGSVLDSDGKISRFEKSVIDAIQNGHKLNYVIYNDLENAVEAIMRVLCRHEKIPIRWSVSRGFTVDETLCSYDIEDAETISDIKNPVAALNFVIGNNEQRVSYVFDDFHHHIGGDLAVNNSVAQIRSLLRDLSRNLGKRDEFVFFMSPMDSLPIELLPVFNMLKEGQGVKGGSFLNKFGSDLTDPAVCKNTKPLVSNGDKVKRIIQILCQMETNNPLLVGGPGVGKTALIEGLAREIVNGNVPPALKGKTIFSLNLNTLVAGSRYRGDFEERIGRLMEEVKSRYRDLIIFIDEIHTLMGAGSAEGVLGAEDILKPALARGDFPCIGATTYEGYELLVKDPALTRRFQKLEIPPASMKETEAILYGIKHIFEKHHDVKITNEAVRSAVRLSEEYIRGQSLPGKAVRLLDSASAFVNLDNQHIVDANEIKEEIKRGI